MRITESNSMEIILELIESLSITKSTIAQFPPVVTLDYEKVSLTRQTIGRCLELRQLSSINNLS